VSKKFGSATEAAAGVFLTPPHFARRDAPAAATALRKCVCGLMIVP